MSGSNAMGPVQAWVWTAALVVVILAMPARVFSTLLLALVVLVLLPAAMALIL